MMEIKAYVRPERLDATTATDASSSRRSSTTRIYVPARGRERPLSRGIENHRTSGKEKEAMPTIQKNMTAARTAARALAILGLLLSAMSSVSAGAAEEPRTIQITVTDQGYEPSRIELEVGESVRLAFEQKAQMECARTVESKELGIERIELPPGKTTVVEVTPTKGGEFTFACGMGMLKGTVVVAAP
ncbi:MAG TPA: cupredoxin domain-containing protein [Planctomycetota bacterium]|nr:cupredoxin domain-containing protein [Planctomycetota bacterium]